MMNARSAMAGLAALAAACSVSSVALASDPTPAPEERTFAWSFNIGATSNYVFRGYAQNKENPTAFAGLDFTYGIAYAGIWAANVDFGSSAFAGFTDTAKQVNTELDIYLGIKPVVGPATFDLGVIYYTYPGANDGGPKKGQVGEQNYLEFKAGVRGAFFPALPKLTLGGTVFYSPEYTSKQGEVWTVEGNAAYELPALGKFTPTVSGTIGGVYGEGDGLGVLTYGKFTYANGKDSYTYWNAGVTLAVEKFSFDFRYWDTDIDNKNNLCNGTAFQCNETFSFTGKFTY